MTSFASSRDRRHCCDRSNRIRMGRQKNRRRNRQNTIIIFQHPCMDEVASISRNTNTAVQQIIDSSAMDVVQYKNQSTIVIRQTPPPCTVSEQNGIMDPYHCHHRSPEAVLFESQPGEIMCCEELSPKIVPRHTKPRLNLDIPESDSASDEQDSEKTNSLTEKTSLDYENEDSDKGHNDHALEKTISIDKVFSANSEMIDISRMEQIPDHDESCCAFTSSSVILPLNNLTSSYARGIELPKAFACSTGHEMMLSTGLSKNQEPRNFDEPKECNYFDVPLSAEPEEQAQALGNVKSGHGLDSELPWISEVHWYMQTGREIFPNDWRMELLKINGASEVRKSRKQRTCEKSRNAAENDDEYFRTRTGSPPAKRCRTTLRFDDIEQTNLMFPPVEVHKLLRATTKVKVDEPSDENVKINWNSPSHSPDSVELPLVSDSDLKNVVTESHVTIHPNSTTEDGGCTGSRKSLMSRLRSIKIPIRRIAAFCEWLAKRMIFFIKRGYRTSYRGFMSAFISTRRSSLHAEEELTQVISIIRCENEKMLSALSEKVICLSNELAQVRVNSETTLNALTSEMSGMREINSKLADKNDLLATELNSLRGVLEKSQSMPNTKSAPVFVPPPPPLPPPPPPLPPTPTSSRMITPMTPNSSRGRILRTPTRKCSTPLVSGRPAITVEDLLKVTLKKAPQNNKENRRNTVPGPRGPVVSLDMLRSVKLKSARRRSSDCNVRSPRRAHPLKIRPAPRLSLSPIMAGADSPLGRILRQVDGYPRRGSKRALSSPTHSENDLTKESPRKFDANRHSKSYSVIA